MFLRFVVVVVAVAGGNGGGDGFVPGASKEERHERRSHCDPSSSEDRGTEATRLLEHSKTWLVVQTP